MTGISAQAEAAREQRRQATGQFGMHPHSEPEAQLNDPLNDLALTFNDARNAYWEAKQEVQDAAFGRLRTYVPFEADELVFSVINGDGPYATSYIHSWHFLDRDGNPIDEVEHDWHIDDLASFFDVEWVGENADEPLRTGNATFKVGPRAEAERLRSAIDELTSTENGEQFRQAYKRVCATAVYVTRARTHDAGFTGLVADASPDGDARVIGFRDDADRFFAFDPARPEHVACSEFVRYAAGSFEPDLVDGQHVLRV